MPGDQSADHVTVLRNLEASEEERVPPFYHHFVKWQDKIVKRKVDERIAKKKRKVIPDEPPADDEMERERERQERKSKKMTDHSASQSVDGRRIMRIEKGIGWIEAR